MKRRQAREDFHKRSRELEESLMSVMREQFEHELNRSVSRINDAIAPYTRFVRSSQERFDTLRADLRDIDDDLRTLRHRIGGDTERAPLPQQAASTTEST
jgi:chaperonin cofactor prefoldin